MESSTQQEEIIAGAHKLLENLYDAHNVHFADPSRRSQLEGGIREIIAALPPDVSCQPPRSRAQALFIHGKALNALPEFSAQAYQCLSKSLKLDPALADAWTAMGCCLVKKEDFVGAQTCFEHALQREPNKESLQMLSMVMRKLSAEPDERLQLVIDAVSRAQDAVKIDMTDSYSWCKCLCLCIALANSHADATTNEMHHVVVDLLGNAHLVHFFEVSHDPEDLKRVQRAYQQAVKHLKRDRCNPDLLFNQGVVFKYLEQYSASVNSFQCAGAEDPTLPVEGEIQAMVRYVSRVSEKIENRVGLKVKKFNSEIAKLHKWIANLSKPALTFNELQIGPNKNVVLSCKIMACYAMGSDPVPVSFVVADQEGTLMGLSIYHVSVDVYSIMKVFDIIEISDPEVRCIQVDWKQQIFAYKSLCIETPSNVVVGDKRLSPREAKLVVSKKLPQS